MSKIHLLNQPEEMEKIHYQDDHAEVIKAAGYTFQFLDGDASVTKSASEAMSRANVDRWKPDKGHFGLHVIAMGSDESIGPNRNGDGWPEQALKDYHDTFTKYGCFFREHKNRCQETEGIGSIKMAAYNIPMSRVELVIWGDKKKAEEEYEMAKAGKELSFSMSARMPFDRCSICDQKSRKQADYCAHLKNHMLQYLPRMKKTAYAINRDNLKFFDISKVGRRADRVATYIRYMFGDDMAKAAAFGDRIITGADWANMEFGGGLGLSSTVGVCAFTPWEESTLSKLAAAEREMGDPDNSSLAAAVRAGAPRGIPQHVLLALSGQDIPALGGELAKKAMVLDFGSFAALVSGMTLADLQADSGFRKAASSLPGLFGGILTKGGCACGDVGALVAPDEFGCALSGDKDMIDKMIREVGDDLGMESDRMACRAVASLDKSASSSVPTPAVDNGNEGFFHGVKEAYGFYAVKAAHIALGVHGVSEATLVRAVPAMNKFPA